ncbi:hypothetical protein [Verrucosispora sp. WMMD573]|uniref:hypothetical protein n=1 Tax=Verrucosispora sp. WMMD573 TaxID=3015149 RepID=UPI00248B970D|nr:hypothetical protein [Verrucosispora sp. WMMD573]WBB52415.1 hypothetical protein O7601_17655 [Verrucosispora sp. WMMD573]
MSASLTIVVTVDPDITTDALTDSAADRVHTQGHLRPTGPVGRFPARRRLTRKLVHRSRGHAAGGPIRLLDLRLMRSRAAEYAAWQRQQWHATVSGTRDAQPWWVFLDRHRADPAAWPISRAQQAYLAQPRVLAMTAYNAAYRQHPIPATGLESLQAGLSTYCTAAALAAVPGDATATATGMWLTTRSGRLSDRLANLHAANDYIDQLPSRTPLVAIAAHPTG